MLRLSIRKFVQLLVKFFTALFSVPLVQLRSQLLFSGLSKSITPRGRSSSRRRRFGGRSCVYLTLFLSACSPENMGAPSFFFMCPMGGTISIFRTCMMSSTYLQIAGPLCLVPNTTAAYIGLFSRIVSGNIEVITNTCSRRARKGLCSC